MDSNATALATGPATTALEIKAARLQTQAASTAWE